MFTQDASGILRSSLLTTVGGLNHGFSARLHGDNRKKEIRSNTLGLDGWEEAQFVQARQVHGSSVTVIGQHTAGTIPDADGLVTGAADVVVGVHTADCVPILLVDPEVRVAAAVHAGWRGTAAGIAREAVRVLCSEGAHAGRILVSIGPYIRFCCYDVNKDRADTFTEKFGTDHGIVEKRKDGRYTLDIGTANMVAFMRTGVLPEHIDRTVICTSCNADEFFSYRKDTAETFGEMIAYIGFRTS